MNHFPWFRLLLVGSAALIIPAENTPAVAQQWHISNPPVIKPVPQYRANKSPSSNNEKPGNNSPLVIQDLPALEPTDQPEPPVVAPSYDAQEIQSDPNDFIPPPIPQVVPVMPESLEDSVIVQPLPDSVSKSHGLDYSIYRNREVFPVDPRKPCNVCTHPPQVRAATRIDWPGRKGQPYQPQEPGGCLCGKHNCPKCHTASIYWPRPLSAMCDRENPNCWMPPYGPQPKKRLTDALDHLAGFKLIPYQRTDNGYCGRGADPYGCLGESKYR